MSYLGNEPPQLAGYSTQTKAAPVGSSIALDQEGTINSTLLFLDGVRQTPTTDYTISGTTLTLTSTAPTAAVATILFLGDVTDIGQPSNDTVDVDQLNTTSAGTTGQFLKKTGASTVDWGTVTTDTSGIEDDVALLGFKVAVNGSLAKYNLVDQTEDAFMDATGIDAGASTNEVRNAANFYSGAATAPTGGTITSYTSGLVDYTVHTFTSDGTLQTYNDGTAEVLIIAGGGGAGNGSGGTGEGGGGGSGGVKYFLQKTLAEASGTYTVTVGTGGTGATDSTVQGSDGLSSVFGSDTSIGGGGGGSRNGGVQDGKVGGSGGGGGQRDDSVANFGAGTANQGNNGGSGFEGAQMSGGGGGAATTVGTSSPSTGVGGAGGTGLTEGTSVLYDWQAADGSTATAVFNGTSSSYAGGGGGGGQTTPAAGGTGGGGAGGTAAGSGGNGTANTGSGGGGQGGDGGKGVVIVRYVEDSFEGHNNMTLQSNATTANDGAPTKGDIVMTYTNGAGTATLNTDLTAEFSADGGTSWTSTTLVAQGTTGTASPHFIVSAHDVTRTSLTGTSMKYRIKTLNQSAAKETRIQAVSLGWS
jgi:hypothetical protein